MSHGSKSKPRRPRRGRERNDAAVLWVSRVVALVAGLGGAALVVGGLPVSGLSWWPGSLVQHGATLIGAALVVFVAAQATVTWAEQRRRDTEVKVWERRSATHEQLTRSFIGQFLGMPADPIPLRSQVVLWCSDDVIAAVGVWNHFASRVVNEHQGDVPDEMGPELWENAWSLVSALRADVDPEHPLGDRDATLTMLFEDYRPAEQPSANSS